MKSDYDLTKEMGIPAATLEKTFKVYSGQAKAQKDPFGMKFFQNAGFRKDDFLNVAIMNPILYYTILCLKIDLGPYTCSRKQAHPRFIHRW